MLKKMRLLKDSRIVWQEADALNLPFEAKRSMLRFASSASCLLLTICIGLQRSFLGLEAQRVLVFNSWDQITERNPKTHHKGSLQ
jgi:hypothetical protein